MNAYVLRRKGSEMFDTLVYATLLFTVAILVSIRSLRRQPLVRVLSVILLLTGLLYREMSLGPYLRALKPTSGVDWDSFVEGCLALGDFARATMLYVLVISVLLFLVCSRATWSKKGGTDV
ncbi:MAG: hypothetical protein ACOY58_05740 [Candidatus Micrarchaeota archaeon]